MRVRVRVRVLAQLVLAPHLGADEVLRELVRRRVRVHKVGGERAEHPAALPVLRRDPLKLVAQVRLLVQQPQPLTHALVRGERDGLAVLRLTLNVGQQVDHWRLGRALGASPRAPRHLRRRTVEVDLPRKRRWKSSAVRRRAAAAPSEAGSCGSPSSTGGSTGRVYSVTLGRPSISSSGPSRRRHAATGIRVVRVATRRRRRCDAPARRAQSIAIVEGRETNSARQARPRAPRVSPRAPPPRRLDPMAPRRRRVELVRAEEVVSRR